MHFSTILLSAALAALATAAVNEPCIGSGGRAGVCISTTDCTASTGTTVSGACPSDPDNIKCCTKPACGTSPGNCRWQSDCAGTSASNLCPGPGAFKCCASTASGFGGYAAPTVPGVGECKAAAVGGAKKIIAAWPGRIRQVDCIRDCVCGAEGGSDHCCGKATDDGGGVPTTSGQQVAEWVMNNRAALGLKYVIWGQRIWNPSQDAVKGWASWRAMEDRGDVTANHWDHVHVSYN